MAKAAVNKVRIKKLVPEAVIPAYAKDGDAGLDFTATSVVKDENDNIVYGTGLAVEIPEGFVGLLFPRSSNAKKDLYLTNHVGVVDSGYRGELLFKFRPTKDNVYGKFYEVGDRIGQMIIMPYPAIEFEEVTDLSDTERGTGGYGSTDVHGIPEYMKDWAIKDNSELPVEGEMFKANGEVPLERPTTWADKTVINADDYESRN